MSDPTAAAPRAVFLSYASQDAEAVRRMAEALRSAGVEVWFDQNELTGGDAWDAKIRKQIAECALFVPLISANTQARLEGYFRIEWKLAAQRTHAMAEEKAFLLPIVIDMTRDTEAKVPVEFKTVQWTKLPGGEAPEKFCQRVKQLLGGAELEVGRHRPAKRDGGVASPARPSQSRPWFIPALVGLAAVAALALWRPWQNPKTTTAVPTAKAAATSAVQPLLDRMAAVYEKGGDATAEDLTLALELGAQAAELDKLGAESWAAYAQATILAFYIGGRTPEQYAEALTRAQRAVSLSSDSFEARFALATVYAFKGATAKEGERMLRQLVAERPTDGRVLRRLGSVLDGSGQYPEALTIIDRALAVSARDAAAWYQRAAVLHKLGKIAEAQEAVEKSLAIRVGARALMEKAYILVFLADDYPAAAAVIEQLPGSVLTRELETWAYGEFWLNHRQPEKALATFAAFSGEMMLGNPKGYFTGAALAMLGRKEAAHVEWRAALKQIEAKLAAKSNDPTSLLWKAQLLASLGERAEGERTLEVARQLADPTEFRVAGTLATLGQREAAISDLMERWVKIKDFYNAVALRTYVLHDPAFDPLRDDPRFQAFVRQISDDPRFPIPRKAPAVTVAPADQSVAVLAFANLSDDKANEYFSDGISEELLNVLAKIPGLKVSARTSAFHFKGKDTPIPEIARQLGVAYVIEGSVRKAGDKVRITAQLIKAADGFHVWSDTFTRDLKDIFAVQDEIAGLIAKNLELKMGMTAARPTIDVEAYEEYLAGRAAAAKASMTDLRVAVTHFERAVAMEPKFTAAWVQLAGAHTRLGRWGGVPTLQAWSAARAAIAKAQALEPDSPDVLLALGWIRRTADWDWRGAEQAFRRTLQLQPNQPDALTGAAVLLFNIGRTEEAFRLSQQAARLDPLNASTQVDLSLMFYFNKNWAESERSVRRALQLAPGGSYHGMLSWSLSKQKRYTEAEAEARLENDELEQAIARSILALARGQAAAIRDCRAQLEAIARKRGDDTADLQQAFAWIDAALGDKDSAFAALEKARASRDPSMAWLRNEDSLAPLFSDPRWDALLRQMGLADDQLK